MEGGEKDLLVVEKHLSPNSFLIALLIGSKICHWNTSCDFIHFLAPQIQNKIDFKCIFDWGKGLKKLTVWY